MKKIFLICLTLSLFGCKNTKKVETPENNDAQKTVEKTQVDEIVNVSFLAVGDNLIHDSIPYYNKQMNGYYDFDPIFENTNQYSQNVDIAYINQETVLGGSELGIYGYPMFNGPTEMIDSLNRAGFDWMSGASNHSFDMNVQGIKNEIKYVRTNYPEMYLSGIYLSQEERDEAMVIEKNGLRIGINTYTYGLNGLVLPEGQNYLVNQIDYDLIERDITLLKEVSDVQIISIHWGNEYEFQPTNEQRELAQFMSDLGVDVIIGTHPHVIQPMEYLIGKDGNETLVMFSLGNFLSAQDENYRMLGGMAKWELSYNKTTCQLTIKNVEFLPTVTYIYDQFKNYRTYALKDYTDELAVTHTLHTDYGQDLSRAYFTHLVNEVMNDEIPIIIE